MHIKRLWTISVTLYQRPVLPSTSTARGNTLLLPVHAWFMKRATFPAHHWTISGDHMSPQHGCPNSARCMTALSLQINLMNKAYPVHLACVASTHEVRAGEVPEHPIDPCLACKTKHIGATRHRCLAMCIEWGLPVDDAPAWYRKSCNQHDTNTGISAQGQGAYPQSERQW